MRLPIMPPISAPPIAAATRSPGPPPNCEPTNAPPSAPTSVPVFSFGPVPVSGLPAQPASDVPINAAAMSLQYIEFPSPKRVAALVAQRRLGDQLPHARRLQARGKEWGETPASRG